MQLLSGLAAAAALIAAALSGPAVAGTPSVGEHFGNIDYQLLRPRGTQLIVNPDAWASSSTSRSSFFASSITWFAA